MIKLIIFQSSIYFTNIPNNKIKNVSCSSKEKNKKQWQKRKYKKQSFHKLKLTKALIKIFTIFFLFILLIMRKTDIIQNKSKTKVAICAIAKKENRYIKYFVEFYKKIGYNHIYFYDNNELGDESIDDLKIVKKGIKEGFITIINYKSRKHVITPSYYDCYDSYNLEYDWISFFDIDEYLILEPKNLSIQEFLDNPRYNNCDHVKINWRVFTDNEQLDYQNRPLMERFPIETNYTYENRHVKTTVRGRLDIKKYQRSYNPHNIWSNIKACSCSGKRTYGDYFVIPPDFGFASLNHYRTKSVREFFYKKFKTKVDIDTIPKDKKDEMFDYFFKINKKTKEKVDIFNQIYHTNYQ